MEIDLLPCPWCGCLKVYFTWRDVGDGDWSGGWHCTQSGCGADGPRDLYPAGHRERAERVMGEAWNHRNTTSEYWSADVRAQMRADRKRAP